MGRVSRTPCGISGVRIMVGLQFEDRVSRTPCAISGVRTNWVPKSKYHCDENLHTIRGHTIEENRLSGEGV